MSMEAVSVSIRRYKREGMLGMRVAEIESIHLAARCSGGHEITKACQ
jgi:hypothetical protein